MATAAQRSSAGRGAGLRPGQVIAGRYRIHRLLGNGAMGEVYRADDLALGRHVALKFPYFEGAAGAVSQRLAAEVAVAQRVSHPNVCRVHELGRHGKRVFLSMEIIEGETLRAVLGRSVGTLTDNEKLRIAHDLCAALAAIHAKGVLFRDLKPGNIMLDSDGRALVTDFGLAACGVVSDPASGTFEYMAPELHEPRESPGWREPSVASDLYGLGLVLYELFAGRPAFSGRDRKKLAARKREGPPAFPVEGEASGEAELQVREVILRCLDPDPEGRPASADEVAAALPERPARGTGNGSSWIVPPETLLVSPRWTPRGWSLHALLGSVLLALLAVAALAPSSQATRAAELGDPPQALEVRAREVLAAAGLEAGSGDEHSGYARGPRTSAWRGPSEGGPGLREPRATAAEPPVVFWYRRNPYRALAQEAGSSFRRYDDPPLTEPGMVGVQLRPSGELVWLEAVPPRRTAPGTEGPPPEWAPLFVAAGLDLERFRPAAPSVTPPTFADHRWAWEGPGPGGDGETVRVEAASFAGAPVFFRLLETEKAARGREAASRARPRPIAGVEMQVASSRTARAVVGLWFAAVLVGAVILARRNLFRRVADRPAAFRLAVAVLLARSAAWLLGARHLPGPAELLLLTPHLARALLAAAQVWVIYLALEPFVRRFWPDLTASWVRLVYGRVADPRVGHDLLVGSLFGSAVVLASRLYATLAGSLGLAPPRLDALGTLAYQVQIRGFDLQCEALRGYRQALAMETLAVLHGLLVSLFAVVGVVLLRLLLKKPWLSRAAALALFVILLFPAAGDPVADLVMTVLACGLWLVALVRHGFLAAATATATAWLLSSHPLTLDPSAWYAPGSTTALLAVVCVALYGFKTSLAGGPMLPAEWLRLDEPRAAGSS